jgi:drug/metabolite transporter (DMT)-like permease
MWFIVAFIGYFFLAVVFVLDKFILTKKVSKPVVYTFYSTIFMFVILLAWPFGVGLLRGIDWWWAICSGVSFGFALWAFFISLEKGEASHISPFNGAFITIFTYILSSVFLAEKLTQMQIAGIFILVCSSFLLSSEKSEKHNGFHIGFVWAILSGLLFAVSHVTAKYLYEIYPFITGFVWTRFFVGVVGLLTLFHPAVLATFKKKKKKTKRNIKKSPLAIIVIDKVLAMVAVIFIQYAASAGSVSLVIAMSGLQFVLMFVIIYLLTKFLPKVFKEYFTKKELIVQVAAIMLVAIGSILFVF